MTHQFGCCWTTRCGLKALLDEIVNESIVDTLKCGGRLEALEFLDQFNWALTFDVRFFLGDGAEKSESVHPNVACWDALLVEGFWGSCITKFQGVVIDIQ